MRKSDPRNRPSTAKRRCRGPTPGLEILSSTLLNARYFIELFCDLHSHVAEIRHQENCLLRRVRFDSVTGEPPRNCKPPLIVGFSPVTSLTVRQKFVPREVVKNGSSTYFNMGVVFKTNSTHDPKILRGESLGGTINHSAPVISG